VTGEIVPRRLIRMTAYRPGHESKRAGPSAV